MRFDSHDRQSGLVEFHLISSLFKFTAHRSTAALHLDFRRAQTNTTCDRLDHNVDRNDNDNRSRSQIQVPLAHATGRASSSHLRRSAILSHHLVRRCVLEKVQRSRLHASTLQDLHANLLGSCRPIQGSTKDFPQDCRAVHETRSSIRMGGEDG